MTSRLRGEDGYATIAVTGIIVAITSLLLVIAVIGSRVTARHEAQVAADLAAVAGAWALATGNDSCAAADNTARDNGAILESCIEKATDIIAVATVRGHSATARAGPI